MLIQVFFLKKILDKTANLNEKYYWMQFWSAVSQKLRQKMTSLSDALHAALKHQPPSGGLFSMTGKNHEHDKADERHVPKKDDKLEKDDPKQQSHVPAKSEPTADVIPPADPNEPIDPNKQKVWPHPPNPGPLDPAPGQGRPS